MIKKEDDETSKLATWLVCLTDGDSNNEPGLAIKQNWGLHKEGHQIDVVIVRVDVSRQASEMCELLCTATPDSIYIDSKGGLSAMDKAFEEVAKVISAMPRCSRRVLAGALSKVGSMGV